MSKATVDTKVSVKAGANSAALESAVAKLRAEGADQADVVKAETMAEASLAQAIEYMKRSASSNLLS